MLGTALCQQGFEIARLAKQKMPNRSAGAAASFKRNFDARFATGEALSAGSR
jgi:hypothetical protein